MESIKAIFELYSQWSKVSPVAAGVVGVWLAGVATYLLRGIPATLKRWFISQTVSRLTMDNAGYSFRNETQFNNFMAWYLKHGLLWMSRNMQLTDTSNFGVGDGMHFFIYKRRLFWFEKIRLNSSGTNIEKREIQISALTRNTGLLKELVEEFKEQDAPGSLRMYRWSQGRSLSNDSADGHWRETATLGKRPMETVAVGAEKLQAIRDGVQWFKDNAEACQANGLSHKFCIVLHGPPGTGKTVLSKAIASEMNRDIYIIDLAMMNNQSLPVAFETVPSGAMILVEDFDGCPATWDRELIARMATERAQDPSLVFAPALGQQEPNLSVILNVLDGIGELNNIVIAMTTNHLDRIDPAMYRSGRCDLLLELPALEHVDIVRYLHQVCGDEILHFTDKIHEPQRLRTTTGSDLQALYRKNQKHPELIIGELLEVPVLELVKEQ